MRATLYFLKHDGKIKAHGKILDLWPKNWPMKDA